MSVSIDNIVNDGLYRDRLKQAYCIPKVPKNYGLLLNIYGLKQTIEVGKVNKNRPPSINLRGTLKWDAWKKWEDKDAEDAKRKIVLLVEEWRDSRI